MVDASLLQDFIAETEEHLEEMETSLLRLESEPDSREIVNDVFRCIHTIKGAAEFVGLEKISELAHRLENLLDELRQGVGELNDTLVDLLMTGRDRISRLVKELESGGAEQTGIDDLMARVDRCMADLGDSTREAPTTAAADADASVLETRFLDESDTTAPDLLYDSGCAAPEPTPGQNATKPSDRAVPPGGSLDLHPSEDELYREENDRELFNIFLQQLTDKLADIRKAVAGLAHAAQPADVYAQCRQHVRVLAAAANYMGYDRFKLLLDDWMHQIEAAGERLSRGNDVSPAFMDRFIEGVLRRFPEAAADTGLPLPDAAAPAPSAQVPAEPGAAVAEAAAGAPVETAPAEENRRLKDMLDAAFDTFNREASAAVDPVAGEPFQRMLFAGPTPAEAEPSVEPGAAAPGADLAAEALLPPADALWAQPMDDPKRPGPAPAVETAPEAADDSPPADGSAARVSDRHSGKVAKKNMRVDTEKIDSLMNQVGELVVSRSWFSQLVSEMRELHQQLKETTLLDQREMKQVKGLAIKISEATSALGRVVNDLQDGVMKIRMLPIAQLFNRYPRLVRDLVQHTGKQVKLEIKGESTELDKMIIEQMSDPLIHVIRNAVDHGIETVEERRRLGKPEEGTLQLIAYHESNHVVIEVVDDGRGIDPENIRTAAVRRQFIAEKELERMTPKELMSLIMRPGFSTAEAVTHTSGRGVGMDVVKKNIEKLNGTIEIDSKPGEETRLRIKIPLTLAIISALLVHVGAKSFAIPLSAVEETLRIMVDQISTVEGFEVIHLRNRTVPLLRLSSMFDIAPNAKDRDKAYVVIVSTGMRRVGLLVDRLIGQEEVVIKPLADYLQEGSAFSGATILGDGKISLIVDVDGLVRLAIRKRVMSRSGPLSIQMPEIQPAAAEAPPTASATLQ